MVARLVTFPDHHTNVTRNTSRTWVALCFRANQSILHRGGAGWVVHCNTVPLDYYNEATGGTGSG